MNDLPFRSLFGKSSRSRSVIIQIQPLNWSMIRSQLEAIIRISESLCKLTLQATVSEHHVDEAIRLFKYSTMQAVQAGNVEGMSRGELDDEINKIEGEIRYAFSFDRPSSGLELTRLRSRFADVVYRSVGVLPSPPYYESSSRSKDTHFTRSNGRCTYSKNERLCGSVMGGKRCRAWVFNW